MTALAPRDTEQAAEFLMNQHKSGSLAWRRACLKLQRMARGLPAVYPTALSAALATPSSEKVFKIADLRRGMVAYCDDPNDSNAAGHIFFIAGWSGPKDDWSNLVTGTNDAKRSGGVDYVPITWYKKNWGDSFMFGATWLNGYDFSEFNKPPVATRGGLGDNYLHALDDLRKARRYHRRKGHDRLVAALTRDIERMKAKLERFGA